MSCCDTLLGWTHAVTLEELRDVFCFDISRNVSDREIDVKQCSKCRAELLVEACQVQVPYGDQDLNNICLSFKICPICNLYQYIWCCKQWASIDAMLDLALPQEGIILKKAVCPKDYIIVYILGQVCHNQHDLDLTLIESPVGYGNFHFTFKLLFEDHCAKGFYILRGSDGNHNNPFLPMVDFLYVRKKYRNNGLGKMILSTILNDNAGAEIHFSVPISSSLCKILSSLLKANNSLKNILWGVDGEDRYNIYYHLVSEHLRTTHKEAPLTSSGS